VDPPPRTSPDSAHTRPNPFRELGIGLLVFACYLAVDLLRPNRDGSARTHGEQLWRLERWLHLDVEQRANSWLNLHHVLRTLFNYEYGTTYIIAAFGLLVWLWFRHPRDYRQARSSFVLLNLIAITTFWLYPVMPPRMLPGFVDTVTAGHTVGSWGSPLVAHANQLAAMPSLHVGWALWVSMVLARLSGRSRWRTQLTSALHVALTCWVVIATANHFVLDAVGAVVAVAICAIAIPADERQRHWHGHGQTVPAADAFFLHIESPRYPQQVGGVVPLDWTRRAGGIPTQADVIELIHGQLPHLPRFRQRLSGPTATMSRWARWRKPRWVDIDPDDPDELDWTWHVPVRDVTRPDGSHPGLAGLDELVAEIAGTQLPMDRPLWRMVVVHGIGPRTAAVVLVVHHVIADGIGTVAQALHLLEPAVPEPEGLGTGRPGPLKRTGAIVLGIAQLAADGRAGRIGLTMDEGHDRYHLPIDEVAVSPEQTRSAGEDALPRAFGRVEVSLDAVRVAARAAGARVSDVLLASVAGGLARLDLPAPGLTGKLRVAVPLMVREPSAEAEGNVTAAVMIDLPTGPITAAERLKRIAPVSRRLRSGSRALASRFVMAQVGGLMPAPMHRWFARTVYGPRTFHAVVSNMPGPSIPLTLARGEVISSYPLLPLAPGTPLTVGTLGWNGALCLAFTAGGWLQPHARELEAAIYDSMRELGIDVGDATPPLTVPVPVPEADDVDLDAVTADADASSR
jgi:WS/DGAT/MGAT family acyltransferase